MTLLFMILIPLIGGIIVFNIKDKKTINVFSISIAFATLLLSVVCALREVGGSHEILKLSSNISISFVFDGLSKFFFLIISSIWFLVSIYAQKYIEHEGNAPRFYGFFLLTLSSMLAIAISANVITFYMCFEFMALLSMPMVLHDLSEKSRNGALMYLGYSTLGASLALLGFFILNANGVSLTFVPGGNIHGACNSALLVAYILVFVGLGAKAGLLPLQMWLTEAHPVAPSPASAVLSGLITKAGVLGIVRMTYYIFSPNCLVGTWVQESLLLLSIITIFFGSMLALREQVLKKRLAYSTISNVSYVLFGLLLFNETAFVGTFLQVLFHALAKCTLFLTAGSIIFKYNIKTVSELRGIGKKMPFTMICFMLASLSLVGIPPFGGFVAKWYLAIGALHDGGMIAMIGVVVLLISALLTAFYLFSICATAFFPGKDVQFEIDDVSVDMLITPAIFAAATLILGLFNKQIADFILKLANQLM